MTNITELNVSIIIPTHNRCESLKRTLKSLEYQQYPHHKMEVIVVADGCEDETTPTIKKSDFPYKLLLIEQPATGAASARNRGAAEAQGKLLIFLDDDISVSPQFVTAHIQSHTQAEQVVVGNLETICHSKTDFFQISLRNWWDSIFQEMGSPSHRFRYQELLSGNFSIEANLFNRLSGFDERFKCREDYELGVRLLKLGVQLKFSKNALGIHHEETNFSRSLKRKKNEGTADIELSKKHPEILETLQFKALSERYTHFDRFVVFLIFAIPKVTDIPVWGLRQILKILEFLKFREYWRTLHHKIHIYYYLRGVASKFSKLKDLDNHLQETISYRLDYTKSNIKVDLYKRLREVDSPSQTNFFTGILLYYKEQYVGYISPEEGCETWKSRHLNLMYSSNLAWLISATMHVKEACNKKY